MREEEREKEKETRAYVVSYWVSFSVTAKDDEEAKDLAFLELEGAIADGSLPDYLADDGEVTEL